MNTIINVMSDTQIILSIGALTLIVCIVAIYRTAVSNKTGVED
jgi:uncharacterized membrane protein